MRTQCQHLPLRIIISAQPRQSNQAKATTVLSMERSEEICCIRGERISDKEEKDE